MTISSEPKKKKIGSLIRTCRLLVRMNRARPDARKSEIMYYQMLADYYTRVLNAQEEGNFLAAHTVFFPSEILHAMDIVPMHTEMTTWLTALFLSEQAELLAAGAELGLAPEICSPHRGVAGAFALGVLPRPIGGGNTGRAHPVLCVCAPGCPQTRRTPTQSRQYRPLRSWSPSGSAYLAHHRNRSSTDP